MFFGDLNKSGEDKYKYGSWLSELLLLAGCGIVLLAFSTLMVGYVQLMLGININKFTLPLATLITLGYIFARSFDLFSKYNLIGYMAAAILMLGTLAIAMGIAGSYYDISYDGQAYHQEAVIQLAQGWNPLREQLTDEATAHLEKWLNHYPKGPWILATAVYKVTNDIETAKAFNLMLIAATFFIGVSVVTSLFKIEWFVSIFIALLLAFNPVATYQSLSFYIDGQLMSLLIIMAAFGAIIIYTNKIGAFIPFGAAMVLLINTKLTAAVYAGLVVLIICLLLWIQEKVLKAFDFFKITIVAGVGAILTIGFNPYITNWMTKGHPLYPAYGSGSADYLSPNMPTNYLAISSPQRLLWSVFSRSANIKNQSYYQLKTPFKIMEGETATFRDTNTKEGGWGPYFSGSLVLTAVLIYLVLIRLSLNYSAPMARALINAGFLGLVIAGSAAVNPLSSAARFVPYLWLLPVVFMIFAFKLKLPFSDILGLMIMMTLMVNGFVISKEYFGYNHKQTAVINERLKQLSNSSNGDRLKLNMGEFGSVKLKLDRYKVRYDIVEPNEQEKTKCKRILPENITVSC